MIFTNAYILQAVCGYLQFGDVWRMTRINRTIRTIMMPLLGVYHTSMIYYYGYVRRVDYILMHLGPARYTFEIIIGGKLANVNHSLGSDYTGCTRVSWGPKVLCIESVDGIMCDCTFENPAKHQYARITLALPLPYITAIDMLIHYVEGQYNDISHCSETIGDVIHMYPRASNAVPEIAHGYGYI